ncbi:MAG: DUF4012 domain-containing protein [Actinomycetes bacterium]
MGPGAEGIDDDRPRWRRILRWTVLGLVVGCLILLVWTLLAAVAAKNRLTAARNDLQSLRRYTDVDRQGIEARLQRDLARTEQARSRLHQLGPAVVSAVPLVGRSIVAERTVADASVASIQAGLSASHDTESIGTTGHINLTELAKVRVDLAAHAARMRGPLNRLASLNTSLTPGPVATGVRQAQDALLGLDRDLQRAADFTNVMGGILGANGPRTVLVALQNNAELRGTGGLISTYALGTAHDGALHMGKFQDVEPLAAPPSGAKPVPAPADYRAHYGPYLANTTIWKDVNFDPDAPTSSQVLSEIVAATAHRRPDVVILLDVPAMAQIVGVTGDGHITLNNGQRLSSPELTNALLVNAYASHADTIAGQRQRRLQLEDAASTSLHRLTSAHPSLKLVRTLANLAAGRHVAVWSNQASEERQLVDVGVAGSVVARGHDIAMVSMTNLGDALARTPGATGSGNKLDFYAHRSLDVEVTVGPQSARVVETLTLQNQTPLASGGRPLPRYVTGPIHPGRMHELIAFSLARDASIESLSRNGGEQVATFDGEHQYRRVSFVSDLERGQQSTWILTYDVPLSSGVYYLDVIPQPLADAATLRVTVTADPGHKLAGLPGAGVRPTGGLVETSGAWTTVEHVAVRLQHRHGWDSFRHAISDFFTKPLGG